MAGAPDQRLDGREGQPRRSWSVYESAPGVLLVVAAVALLALVVASSLGWLF